MSFSRPLGIIGSGQVLLLGWALVVGMGCEEYYTGMGERALEPPGPECVCNCTGGGGVDDAGPGVLEADITGFTYRFSSMNSTAPIEGDNASSLNEFFSEGIADHTLNVLLNVTDFEADEQLQFLASGGVFEGGKYLPDPEGSSIPCSLNGTDFDSTQESSLTFALGALSEPLPVVSLSIGGRFSPDGTRIIQGRLVGALRVEDTKRITVDGLSLDGLLRLFQAQPELDLDGDQEPDAYRFEGTYTAEALSSSEIE